MRTEILRHNNNLRKFLSMRVLFFLPFFFTITSCNLPPSPYSASTPFIVSDSNIEIMNVEVRNHDPFFLHPVQYLEQAVIEGSYKGKVGKEVTSENKLFATEIELEYVPGETPTGAIRKTLFCGLVAEQSGFERFMTGPETGDRILCFNDVNNDGQFDLVYNAVGALEDPVTVFVVEREATTLENKISYRKLQKNEKDDIGSVWFQIRSPLMASKYIDFYLGGAKDKEVISNRPLPSLKKNEDTTFILGGAQIELLSIDGGNVKLRLDKPIRPDRKIGVVKTITTRVAYY